MREIVTMVGRRLLEAALTLLAASLIIFLVGHLTGDPAEALASQNATTGEINQLRAQLGLDLPLWHQYTNFLTNAVRGNLGVSYVNSESVVGIIRQRIGASLQLALLASIFALAISVPLGVLAAVRRGTLWDRAAVLLGASGQAVPSFMIGLILILLFSVRWHLLPAGGDQGFESYLLPAATLACLMGSGILRLLRSGMIEALESDYVRFARSLGVTEANIVWRWALRNALLPVVAFTGFMFSLLIGGAIGVEVVFAWPGVGQLAYNAVLSRDFPTMQGVVLVWAVIVVAASMLTDLAFRVLDPRART
jgi:ABC-type dipeptide/oligopeptide/nickel transport system permease component